MRYDSTSVADRYHNSRALTSADMSRWVRLVQEVIPQALRPVLVDLGCGTGRFTAPLAEQLGVSIVGVDPSQTMLREAARNTGSAHVEYREGSAESIPLDIHSAALIFMSNAIHHVKNLDKALLEMRRVLQSRGIAFIRNYSLENLQSLHYLQFFPEAMQVSQEMIWPRDMLIEHFTARGFTKLSQGTVHQEASPSYEAYLRKIESRVYSDLTLIPDEAFDLGVARMKEVSTFFESKPVMEEVDYFIFQKPV